MKVATARPDSFDRNHVAGRYIWLAPLVLFTITILARLPGLADLPMNDEFYTLLAARGWLLEGQPQIADGLYPRAELFTILTAQAFAALGESFVVARLPALVAGGLLVVLVFIWTRAHAGHLAAWIAALLLALAPIDGHVSTMARFYTIHGLLFWLAAIGVFALTDLPMSWLRRAGLALAIGFCLLLALHLQPLTLIGAGGLALWLAGAAGLPWLRAQRRDPRRFWLLLGGLALGGILGVVVVLQSGIAQEMLSRYRWTPVHSEGVSDQIWYYHLRLIERYPTLWPIFPFTVLLALASKPRPTLFCLSVFVPALAVLSFGAMKHTHYLYFLQPFLFVVWGIALARAWRFLRRCVLAATDRALRQVAPALAGWPARALLIAGAVLFLLVANGAPARTLLKPFGVALGENERATDWTTASTLLEPWLRSASVILTANDLHALYYLGDYDFAINASRVSETPSGAEFARDPRTGRPALGTPESLERILECYPSGLILTDTFSWRASRAITDPVANLIVARTEPIALPGRLRLMAFSWQRQDPAGPPATADCAALPEPSALGD